MNRIVDLLGAGEKQWGCELLPYNFSSKKPKQTNKQTNKQFTSISCEKSSCLIRSKKKKQSKTNKQRVQKLIKMIMEAIIGTS